MRILGRNPVSKYKSARKFRSHVSRTKAPNINTRPMRGGIRF